MEAEETEQSTAEQAPPGTPGATLPWRRTPLGGAVLAAVALAAVAAVTVTAMGPPPGTVEIAIGGELVYHDFPDIIADLKGGGRRSRYVKLGIIVELPAELRPRLEAGTTGIVDALHAYLRERRADELVGGAGADRVRTALRQIINDALAPGEAKAVLFRQFILN